MRRTWRILFFSVAFLAILLSLGGCHASDEGDTALVRVMLLSGEGYTVEGENPLFVRPGEDAVFRVSVEEGYTCIQSSKGSTYSQHENTLTVSDVRYPLSVSMRTGRGDTMCKYFLDNVGNGGYMGTDVSQGLVFAGTVVNVYVNVRDGFRFDGWTLNRAMARGGKFISADERISYTVDEDTFLYANFTRVVPEDTELENVLSRKTRLITYDANGGVYTGTTVERVPFEVRVSHIYENSFAADGVFTRDGYVLIGYSTSPDGSTDFITPGSKIVAEEDEDILLYCIWSKETELSAFTWETGKTSVTLTGYTGTHETVTIPAKIDGKPVVRIQKGTFQDAPFTTLVLPSTVRNVESGAVGCTSNFTTLYLFDTIRSIANDSFSDTSHFRNFRFCAAQAPVYTNSVEGNASVKWERLVSESEKPRLIILAGSSSLYGLNSPMLEAALGDKYTVINFGVNAGVSGILYMDMLEEYLREGDILVHAAEVNNASMHGQSIAWRIFRATEYYYNFWNTVDIGKYPNLFSELTEHASIIASMQKLDYTKTSTNLNEYGDIGNTTAYNVENYHAGTNINLPLNTLDGEKGERLRAAYESLLSRGVRVYVSCAPYNENALTQTARTAEHQDAYIEHLRDSLNVPVISHIRDYALPGELMYNSDYHPNVMGRDRRTEQLIEDLKVQLEKDGISLPPPVEG